MTQEQGISRNADIKVLLPAFLAIALFAWMYLRDLDTFLLPDSLLIDLYSYTALFLVVFFVMVRFLRRIDLKYRPENSRLRNNIRLLLGSFWIIDGLLQIQPQMPFGFSHFILYNSLQSFPNSISGTLFPLIVLWNSHGMIFDALAGAIQIFLGLSLLLIRSRQIVSRVATLSTVWALAIWFFGEGIGGVLQPGLSLISGYPGGALIYALLGIMLIIRGGENITRKMACAILGSILLTGSVIQVIPFEGFWVQYGLASIPGMLVTNSQPLLISSILAWFANLFSHNWVIWNVMFSLAFVILGTLWFTRPRAAGVGTILVMGLVWLFGQDLGIFGFYGTDLNSALPFLLLAFVTVSGNFRTTAKDQKDRVSSEDKHEVQARTG